VGRQVRHFLAGEELVHVDFSDVLRREIVLELDEGEEGDEQDCDYGDASTEVGGLGAVRWGLLEDIEASHSLLERHRLYKQRILTGLCQLKGEKQNGKFRIFTIK
jgi:hypothetical protein